MKIFVCEYISGGGLCKEIIPASLAREGLLMRDAVIRDFSLLAGVELLTTSDIRLPAPENIAQSISVDSDASILNIWWQCINQADVVMLIAPETSGVLAELTMLVEKSGKRLLGSDLQAVNIASLKSLTCEVLSAAGVSVLPCYRWPDIPAAITGPLVAKMDDGAGCEDSAYFESRVDLDEWIKPRMHSHIVQAYQPGMAASISILCREGKAWLLSCNQQKITLEQDKFHYTGSVLNGMQEYWTEFQQIADKVAKAIPGLFAYVGIDLIVQGGNCYVLEVNPRLTTSYVGMHQAIAGNPARLMLELAYNMDFVMPEIARNRVEISINE